MNTRQLILAREFRGYTQSELANSIPGLSQSNLSKFEKGLATLSEDNQSKIIRFLNFPAEFFDRKINSTIENGNYRKRTNISKTLIKTFENKCRIIGYVIDEMSESLEWPEFKLSYLDLDQGYDTKYVAHYTRKLLKLNYGDPVRNICGLLEQHGILIYEIEENEKFDGVSFFTDKGFPVIVINKNFSNDRKRFSLAHELGHLLMHNELQFPISPVRDKEKETNEFASEFLMPEDDIKSHLRGLKFSDLSDLKDYWLTSMQALIRRAKDLNCITPERYQYFMIEISRNGFNKKEPGVVFIDSPQCFRNGYNLFTEELLFTEDDFIESFALPRDIIKEIFTFNRWVQLRRA